MKTFSININDITYDNVYLMKGKYPCGDIGLFLMDNEGYLCDLTVSIDFLPMDTVALDVNNTPDVERIVKELGIGTPTGKVGYSGFCEYPLYKLDMDRVNELCEGGTANG